MNFNFLKTPKKPIVSLVFLLCFLVIAGSASVFAINSLNVKSTIGKATALNTVLEDIGLSKNDIDYINIDLEYNNGSKEYEVALIGRGNEYKYVLDANSGAILAKNVDEGYNALALNTTDTTLANNVNENIANTPVENEAPLSATLPSDSTTSTTLNEVVVDNQATVNSLPTTDTATPPTVDTATYPTPKDDGYNNYQAQTGDTISVDEAKSIALSHAGLDVSQIMLKKAKLDKEHGRLEYEIEFYYNNIEYEYSIDAVSGTIVDFEYDYD